MLQFAGASMQSGSFARVIPFSRPRYAVNRARRVRLLPRFCADAHLRFSLSDRPVINVQRESDRVRSFHPPSPSTMRGDGLRFLFVNCFFIHKTRSPQLKQHKTR